MALEPGVQSTIDREVAAAARRRLPGDRRRLPIVSSATAGDADALAFVLQMIDRHRLAVARCARC
ncbi:MAG: hypothetical protein R2713_13565 [Ilumatobacteraceae bacterium]